MAQLLDFSTSTALSKLVAGLSGWTFQDGVEIDINSLGYPLQNTDCAALNTQGSTLTAHTVLDNAGVVGALQFTGHRQPQAVHPTTKDTYYLQPPSGNNINLNIVRYSSAGVLLGSAVVDLSGNTTYLDSEIAILSNGNILVSWAVLSNTFKFMVFDKLLNTVAAATTIAATIAANVGFQIGVLTSTAQFAAMWVDNANNLKAAVYNNDGTVAVAAYVVLALTGAAANVVISIGQLSNGNILYTWTSKYATTVGLYFAIYPTGTNVAVVAATVASNTTPSANCWNEQAIVNGFFATGFNTGAAGYKFAVFSNAGVQQGTTQAVTGNSGNIATFKLLSDTTNVRFIVIASNNSTTNALTIATLTTAGVLSSSLVTNITQGAGGFFPLDAAIDRGTRVAIFMQSSGTTWAYLVFNLQTSVLEKNTTTMTTGAPAGTPTTGPSMALLADFVMSAVYMFNDGGSNIILAFQTLKHSASGIIGSSVATVAASALGYLRTAAGTLAINGPLTGSGIKSFDHSAGTPKGNKGTLSTYGMTVVGIS